MAGCLRRKNIDALHSRCLSTDTGKRTHIRTSSKLAENTLTTAGERRVNGGWRAPPPCHQAPASRDLWPCAPPAARIRLNPAFHDPYLREAGIHGDHAGGGGAAE
ncbi:hypothetical protein GCM10023170_064100 [Phytohabitans houttuyneae]|uniref:Uncharacterized protein n=1 Tax=Phytohabitans houttuyneae TaxID=1076126 RepID=A0A6V8KH63_9ACTN|nr:hypothetical protein Phou_059180 [Phytohabitans houttuyneae]